MEGNSHFTRARANQKSYQLKFFSKSKLHKVLINQAFTYCFNFLHHFLKQKASVPLVISPQFSKRWQLGVGGIPPRLGLTAGFPAMPSAKKKNQTKKNPQKNNLQNKNRRGTTVPLTIHSKTTTTKPNKNHNNHPLKTNTKTTTTQTPQHL